MISVKSTRSIRPFTQDDSPALLWRLWQHIGRRRQLQFVLVLGLMFVSAFAEVISLGAVLPFIGILTAPERILSYPVVATFAHALGIDSADDLVLPLTIAFVTAAVFAGAIRLLLLWVSSRLGFACGAELSVEAYRRTLYQPYQVHIARNTSTMISGITQKVGVATALLINMMHLVSAVIIIVAVTLTLLSINTVVATVTGIGFGSGYWLISRLSRRRLERNSKLIAQETTQVVKTVQEGLGGIRDVLLDGTQPLYCEIYSESQTALNVTTGQNQFIGACPRPAMEALGVTLIAVLAYLMSLQPGGVATALPVLAALALGAQRMLPALQTAYGSWSGVTGNLSTLVDALELLDQPLPADFQRPVPAPLLFRDCIRFDAVRFRFTNDGPWVLDRFDLEIPKGARIGFVGSTGSGKSTLLDLLMGLLEPVEGQILVDGHPSVGERRRAWQQTIAHVPQSIYLADTTLAENIAFGVSLKSIDMERVRQAAQKAQISDFVESHPEGYQAFVGERGIRLSGGQRQRIGIARALYKRASVLVFDEATSALDNETERTVMDTIEGLSSDLTILLIAHRLTTVQHCDKIVELNNGRVIAQGTYAHLLEHSPSFRKMALGMTASRPLRSVL